MTAVEIVLNEDKIWVRAVTDTIDSDLFTTRTREIRISLEDIFTKFKIKLLHVEFFNCNFLLFLYVCKENLFCAKTTNMD